MVPPLAATWTPPIPAFVATLTAAGPDHEVPESFEVETSTVWPSRSDTIIRLRPWTLKARLKDPSTADALTIDRLLPLARKRPSAEMTQTVKPSLTRLASDSEIGEFSAALA